MRRPDTRKGRAGHRPTLPQRGAPRTPVNAPYPLPSGENPPYFSRLGQCSQCWTNRPADRCRSQAGQIAITRCAEDLPWSHISRGGTGLTYTVTPSTSRRASPIVGRCAPGFRPNARIIALECIRSHITIPPSKCRLPLTFPPERDEGALPPLSRQ